ncbi:MAG TPA: inorganic diphosphatase [Acidimicrobiales bacterium]|jgi:inorganic pyrophosphatase|nr:inorganic diphosphatase [Acidimicrobiales bacterium]
MADDAIDVFIDTPKGSRAKYEWDPDRGGLRLDRRLYSATVFPADYGYVADTTGADGEALDALVLSDDGTFPGCWVAARPCVALHCRSRTPVWVRALPGKNRP